MSEMKCYRQGESIHTDKFPKCQIQFIHGDTMTLFVWAFEEGGFADAHVHPHEQIIHCKTGTFEVTVGDEVVVLQAGDTVTVPSGVRHSAYARTAAQGVDVFHPVREDMRF